MAATTGLVSYLLLISLALVSSSLLDTEKMSAEGAENVCRIERMTMTVKFEGCEDASIIVRACNGVYTSGMETILEPPYFYSECKSCRPTVVSEKYKFRRVKSMCNGTETIQQIYWPLIKECGFVDTRESI